MRHGYAKFALLVFIGKKMTGKRGKPNIPFKPFFVTSIYCPSGIPVTYFNEHESLFGRPESQYKESIIMGDINCDFNTPWDNTKHLNNILNSFGYSRFTKDATRTTKTTSTIIDHVMTNRPGIISSSVVRPCGISDHNALILIRNARAPKLEAPTKVKVSEITKDFIRKISSLT